MPPTSPDDIITAHDIIALTKSVENVNDVIDDLSDSVHSNALDHTAIKTTLENVLSQLRGLNKTVSGDSGLVSRVSVLESEVKRLNDENARLRAAQDTKMSQEVTEAKNVHKDSRSARFSTWSATISTLALLTTLALFGLQNCQTKTKVIPVIKEALD